MHFRKQYFTRENLLDLKNTLINSQLILNKKFVCQVLVLQSIDSDLMVICQVVLCLHVLAGIPGAGIVITVNQTYHWFIMGTAESNKQDDHHIVSLGQKYLPILGT